MKYNSNRHYIVVAQSSVARSLSRAMQVVSNRKYEEMRGDDVQTIQSLVRIIHTSSSQLNSLLERIDYELNELKGTE